MDKKEFFKDRIDKIAKESFNEDQKAIAKKIIDNADDSDVDAVWQLVSQRVKTGFVFDKAPEINHNCVAYLKENEKLGINLDKKDALEHSLIIGENYDALKNLLAVYTDKQGKGLIDIIYIDPPYNTEKSKEEGNDYKEEVESNKFIYRDKFTRDGWLNMMNERLQLARKLLSDKGVIFISCDDSEQAYLKVLCDEIFGEENFVGQYHWLKSETPPNLSKKIKKQLEYILCYERKKDNAKYNGVKKYSKSDDPFTKPQNSLKKLTFPKGTINVCLKDGIYKAGVYGTKDFPNKMLNDMIVKNGLNDNDVTFENKFIWVQDTLDRNINEGINIYIRAKSFVLSYKRKNYGLDIPSNLIDSSVGVDTTENASSKLTKIMGYLCFDYPKDIGLIKYLLSFKEFKDPVILDFFAGSGTTGQAVMELNEEDGGNRKFILVTNNENNIAKEITRERLCRVINGKGSKGEDFEWQYSENKKYLDNNSVRVFDIEKAALNITEIDKAEKIKKIAEENFVKLNPEYKINKNLDIYNVLASLTPYKDKSEE